MKNIKGTLVRMGGVGLLATTLTLSLAACNSRSSFGSSASDEATAQIMTDTPSESAAYEVPATTANISTSGAIDTTDLFTERDLVQVADTTDATYLTVSSGQDIQITEEGVYVVSGEASEATITVSVEDGEKVQLVLDGVSITNTDAPAIYVTNADKVFVTTVEGTTNTLKVTGAFAADGDTNVDAVIFSKDDLVLNGLGTLQVSSTGNGISSKDDLKVTGGTYAIECVKDALEANDAILVADGSLTISCGADGLHAENDEDDTVGCIYLCGGSIAIDASSDALHATTILQIDGGSLALSAGEGLEATYVQVNGGTIDISASDDGINASYKSTAVGTPTIEITGGSITISMAAGDTDALDVNGNLIVSGGEISITGQFAFDFDGTASFTGGTITVNGEQISEITNSMMMGGMEGGGMGGMVPQQDGGMPPQDNRG